MIKRIISPFNASPTKETASRRRLLHLTFLIMKRLLLFTILPLLAITVAPFAGAAESTEIPLTARGQELQKKFTKELESLRAEVIASLPPVNDAKKARFLEIRTKWNGLPNDKEDGSATEKKALDELKETTQTDAMEAAGALLTDLKPLLSSDALDPKLMRIAILNHGTPRGLAEFAQQGPDEEKLLEKLFADEPLMRQILEAGGANGGEYGEAMQVYEAILKASERAREVGSIFQRLALGTSIHMPWLQTETKAVKLDAEAEAGAEIPAVPLIDKKKGGVYGIVFNTQTSIAQVPRYLHYEKAFLDGELDPAFKDMNTWECRFITDSEYSNEDLAWTRQMMRNYRPDHITTEDTHWRYVRLIKSDVPYCSTTHDPSLGTRPQMEIALGGICGRRAFLGRLTSRAFGIPTRASTQTGHGAMCHWTPTGWVICLGAWWSVAYCGPQDGLDFLLDSQAREFEADYQQVRRAQWIGDAYGEEDVKIARGQFSKGGGFWDSLALLKKQIVVKEAEVKALELAGGMKLGESDELLGDEKGEDIEIPEADQEIKVSEDGTITVPAVACYSPRKSSDRILFLKSWDKGYQLHYSRLGERPELFKYNIEIPADGEYELTCMAATVSPNVEVLVRVNRDEPAPFAMPYTHGSWESSKPLKMKLTQGRNVISITARTPNRGVSIKNWQLKPVK
jgi:hypothetical protein